MSSLRYIRVTRPLPLSSSLSSNRFDISLHRPPPDEQYDSFSQFLSPSFMRRRNVDTKTTSSSILRGTTHYQNGKVHDSFVSQYRTSLICEIIHDILSSMTNRSSPVNDLITSSSRKFCIAPPSCNVRHILSQMPLSLQESDHEERGRG